MKAFKLTIIIVTLLFMFVTFVCCSGDDGKNTGEGKKIQLRISHPYGPNHPWHKGIEKFQEVLKNELGAQVQLEIYPNASLSEGNERTMVEQLGVGTLDLAVFAGSLAGTEFSAFAFPFLFDSRKTVMGMLSSPIALELLAKTKAKGFHGLAYWENGFRQITNNVRPIHTPADITGLKIRAPQVPQTLASLKALGANPTSVSLGELYVALSQGIADGQENPLPTIYNERFFEVQKYCTVFNYQWTPAILAINSDLYNTLPDNVKKAMEKAAKEGGEYASSLIAEQDKILIGELRATGIMEVYEPTEDELALFKAATSTQELRSNFDNIVGKDLLDRFIAEVHKIQQK